MNEAINLIHGDCLEEMKQIPDKSVQLILCDLPYGTTKNKWDSVIPMDPLWEQYNRIIKDNGVIALWAQVPFSMTVMASNPKMLRYEWIIEKTSATGFLNANRMPMKAHESVFIFYKRLPKYHPQKTLGHKRKVSKAEHKHSDSSSNYNEYDKTTYDSTERYPRDVLTFAWDKQKKALHPTQKPVSACEYFIKTYTDEGDLVLDNCMGSGTTAIACINTNRTFIGIELKDTYYNIALQRVSDRLYNSEQERNIS